ncbi:MAG: hypothetical protein AABM43_06225 [Actinomycetota bacterium]
MKRLASRRPSPSFVLSVIAVLIALGGQAGALPGKHSVGKGDLAKGAVTAVSLAPGAVTDRAIAKRAIHGSAIASKAIKARMLAPGSVDAGALGSTTVVQAQIPDRDTAVDSTYTSSGATLACPGGQQLLSGGVQTVLDRILMTSSRPGANADRWEGAVASDAGGTFPVAATLDVLCLK